MKWLIEFLMQDVKKGDVAKIAAVLIALAWILQIVLGFVSNAVFAQPTADLSVTTDLLGKLVDVQQSQAKTSAQQAVMLATLVGLMEEQTRLLKKNTDIDDAQLILLEELTTNLKTAMRRQVTKDDINALKN